jgi:hypothetical protein
LIEVVVLSAKIRGKKNAGLADQLAAPIPELVCFALAIGLLLDGVLSF